MDAKKAEQMEIQAAEEAAARQKAAGLVRVRLRHGNGVTVNTDARSSAGAVPGEVEFQGIRFTNTGEQENGLPLFKESGT